MMSRYASAIGSSNSVGSNLMHYRYFLTNICGIDRPSALSIPVLRSAGIIASSYIVIDVLALTRWELPL